MVIKRRVSSYITLSVVFMSLVVLVLSTVQGVSPASKPMVNVSDQHLIPETNDVLAKQVLVSQFQTGASFTQDTFEYGSNTSAVNAGKALLSNSTYFLNVHIMGFGPGNPQPSPGTYSWASLDARLNGTANEAKAQVLTACCAPSWMKGGASDFGSGFEIAPTSDYYDDYANLVAAAVQRYPSIKYVQVWNEFKGFWNSSQNRWNYEAYTSFYNQVYAAVKAVNPSVKVGGPYTPLRSNGGSHSYNSGLGGAWGWYDQRYLDTITYWLQHKSGADFLTIDGSISSQDGVNLVGEFDRLDKYPVFMSWLRGLNNSTYPGAQTLPVWWAEWYARPDNVNDPASKKNALMAAGLIKTLRSGVQTALIWAPEGDSSGNSWPLGLFNNTYTAGGGQATLFHQTQSYINNYFSAGTGITDATSTNTNVELLASSTKLLMVNKSASTQTTSVLGVSYTLSPYEVALKDTPSQSSSNPTSPSSPSATSSSTASSSAANGSAGTGSQSASKDQSGQSSTSNSSSSNQPQSNTILDKIKASPVGKVVGAFGSNTPVTVGSVELPSQPIKYTSLAIFVTSSGILVYLQRQRIRTWIDWLLTKLRNLRSPSPPTPPTIVTPTH